MLIDDKKGSLVQEGEPLGGVKINKPVNKRFSFETRCQFDHIINRFTTKREVNTSLVSIYTKSSINDIGKAVEE